MSVFPELRKQLVRTGGFISFTVYQKMYMRAAFLSDCQAVDVFQIPPVLFILCSQFPDQLCQIFFHLFPCGTFSFFVGKRHPVIAWGEVPLDQSPDISLPSPLILLCDLFRSGFSFFFSYLPLCSIPSCMLLLYLYGAVKLPYLSDICPPHISVSCRKSNTPNRAFKRLSAPEKELKI